MTFNFSGSFEMINAANHFARLNGWSQREARGALIDLIEIFATKKTDTVPRRLLVEAIGEVAVQALIDFEACSESGDQVICHESTRVLHLSGINSDKGKRSAESKRQKKAALDANNSIPVEKKKTRINRGSTAVQPLFNNGSTDLQPNSTEPQPHDHSHDHSHDHTLISSSSKRSEVPPELEAPEPKKPKSEHHDLVEKLTQTFLEIRGAKYPFSPRDAKVVKDLRATAPPEQILDAWRKALAHAGFPAVGTLAQLQQNFAMFVGTGPPSQKTNAQKVTEVGVFKENRIITGKDLPWRSKST